MSDEAATVECPYCHERIAAGAVKCRHCGEHLVVRPRLDRPPESPRLKAAGALQVALGAMAGIMVPCAGLGVLVQQALPPAQRQSVAASLAGVLIYAGLAAFLVWSGIGAWRHRRWARPLMLSICVPGLFLGVVGTACMAFVLPAMMKMTMGIAGAAGGPGAPPAGFLEGVMIFTLVLTGAMYVGLPGLFAFLYWPDHLRTLCEKVDETPRWTDGVPLPVLATTLWLAFMAAGSLIIPAYGVVPFFGALLTGPLPFVYALGLAVAAGGLAFAVFRRHLVGWLGTLVLVLVLGASHLVSFSRVPMIELYRAMPMPPAQLQAFEGVDLSPMNQVALGGGAAVLVALLVFLVHLRRYFVRA